MTIIEEQSTFENPYDRSAFWVVDMYDRTNCDFYYVAKDSGEIARAVPSLAQYDMIDTTEHILAKGPAPESLKRLLAEDKFGRIECSVGDGLHKRKWRWSQDLKE